MRADRQPSSAREVQSRVAHLVGTQHTTTGEIADNHSLVHDVSQSQPALYLSLLFAATVDASRIFLDLFERQFRSCE